LLEATDKALESQLLGRPDIKMEEEVRGASERNIPVSEPILNASKRDFLTKESFERSSWDHNIDLTPYDASPDKISSHVLAKLSSNLAFYTNFSSISSFFAIASRSFGGFFREKSIDPTDADADAEVHYEVSN
jgi:hypothetical protein